jgi:hydroxyacylglutathione hydrolase
VLLTGFPAAAFGTNCYVLAPAAGEECLIVDPGVGVDERLVDVLTEFRLRPAAVLLTHGHLDHVYAVTPVCGGYRVAAHVHGADRYRLTDPVSTLDPGLLAALEQQYGRRTSWSEPDDVIEVVDGAVLDLAGLRVTVVHAPGHTEGSVLFTLPGAPDRVEEILPPGSAELPGSTVLTGDVLFAGGIGRTDLPGGDPGAMRRTLRERVLPLPDTALVLPGHGPGTTMSRERVVNPFLQDLHHP